jgi:hyperosmotically inducible protein
MSIKKITALASFYLFFTVLSVAFAGTLQQAGQALDDTAITTSIKAQYVKDSLVNPFDISVATSNGIVTLAGTVNTNMQYERAISIAEASDGVKDVNADGLKVKDSQSALSDSYITAKLNGLIIKNKIFGDKDVKFTNIDIETKDGVVYLSGQADNTAQIKNIIDLANSIKGVKSVKSAIKVKPVNS